MRCNLIFPPPKANDVGVLDFVTPEKALEVKRMKKTRQSLESA